MNLDLDKGIYRGKKLDIVVDFDGTCVSHEFPNVGKSIGSESVLHELVANGHNLILFTMRSNQGELPLISKNGKRKWQKKISANYLDDAVKWFEKNNIPLYGVQKNPTQKKCMTLKVATVLLLLAFICSASFAQKRKGFWLKESAAGFTIFAGGAARGYNQVINYRYDAFERIHPNANDQWWWPGISYLNKYKNRDPAQGPAYWGSTTILVAPTDAHHATNSISVLMFAVSMGFQLSLWEKPNLVQIGLQVAGSALGFAAGKGLIHQIYK